MMGQQTVGLSMSAMSPERPRPPVRVERDQALIEALRQGPARDLPDAEAVFRLSRITDRSHALLESLERFDAIASLPPGQAVQHTGFGAGRIECVLASPKEFDYGQGDIRELFRVSLASPRQEGFEGRGIRLVREPVPKSRRELRDAIPAFWRAQNPAERGKSLRFQIGRCYSVRRDHEILDQLLCPIPGVEFKAGKVVPG